MNLKIIVAILYLLVILSACATYPQNPDDQAAYHANEARAAILKGDSTNAANEVDFAIARPTGIARIKEVFAHHPTGRDYYIAYIENELANISRPYQAAAAFEKLSIAKSAEIFREDQIRNLFEKLSKVVADGNTTGTIPFDLGDKIDIFPDLRSPSHLQIIANRTIKNLQNGDTGRRSVSALMEYVQLIGVDSVEGRRIESLLPTLNVRRDELEVVAKIFPDFAAIRRERITARVFLQIKNGDRLLSDDLLQLLRIRVRGVEWVSSVGPKTTALIIERLRNDERSFPEKSQTITYAQHEVNLLSAALLMPRNASYLYEVVSGGAEIEYGYVVSATEDGLPIFDEVIRGKVIREYHRCQNARIQNVFGGVSSAGFVANIDMQQRCGGPSTASIDELRKEVLERVVAGILKIPPIKVAHELN